MTRLRISRIVVAALLAALAQGSYAQTAPPAAANAGFTRLLANQDFSTARVDLGCAGASQKHFWNQGLWYEKTFPPCDQISSVSEPIAGHNVLDLRWLPSQNDPYDATTIETMAGDYSQFYGFQHGYYEAIFRVSPWNIGGLWPEFWMWGANSTIFANEPPWSKAPDDEIDVIEPHGETPNLATSAIHGWGTNNNGFIYQSAIAGLDYTQYHKFGLLWTGNGEWKAGTVCFYLDDVKKGCAVTDASAEYQRHFLILSMGVGCQYKAGNRSCLNVPVTGIADSGSGLVRLAVGSTTGFVNGNSATISGVGGIAAANGVFAVTVVDGAHLDLQGSKFSGTYTGGGVVNPLTQADLYVKSVRVWGCAADVRNGC